MHNQGLFRHIRWEDRDRYVFKFINRSHFTETFDRHSAVGFYWNDTLPWGSSALKHLTDLKSFIRVFIEDNK